MSLLSVFASTLAPGGKYMRQASQDSQQTTYIHWRVVDNSLEKKHSPDECSKGVCKP